MTTISTQLMSDFANASLLSWLGASYFIANAWAQPLCGQLTDVYSRRTGLMLSVMVFIAGNGMSGLASSSPVLVAGRFTAGIGGGSFIVITTMVANDLVSPRARGLYQGCTNLIYAMGHSSGGILSALITRDFSWRWSFFSLVGLSIVTASFLGFVMPKNVTDPGEENETLDKTVDYKGALFFSVATFLLLFGVNDVAFSIPSPWARFAIILVAACGTASIFIRHSIRTTSRPVLPIRLLRERSILAGCLINFCACCCFTVSEFFLPIIGQLQSKNPNNVIVSSVILIPLSAGAALGSMVTGVILLYYNYPRSISIWSFGMVFVSSIFQGVLVYPAISNFLGRPEIGMIISTLFCGIGFGSLMTSSLVAVVLSLDDQRDSARVTSLLFTFRSFGSALGLTLASLVCQAMLRLLIGGSSLMDEQTLHRVLESPLAIFDLPLVVRQLVLDAYLKSIAILLFSCAGVSLLGILVAAALLPKLN